MNVVDLLDTNAGDEQHRAENWTACPGCGRESPADYDDCAFCGVAL